MSVWAVSPHRPRPSVVYGIKSRQFVAGTGAERRDTGTAPHRQSLTHDACCTLGEAHRLHHLLLLRHRAEAELLVKRKRRGMVERAGLDRHPARPVRPAGFDGSTEKPATYPLPHRVLHHAEIGKFHILRQVRTYIEQTSWRAVEIKDAYVSVLAVNAGGKLLVREPKGIDPVPLPTDPIHQVAIEMERYLLRPEQCDLPIDRQ